MTAERNVHPAVTKVIATEVTQGFRGVETDPTPNEAYTVAGVTAGAPTPETDLTAARDAAARGVGPGGDAVESLEQGR